VVEFLEDPIGVGLIIACFIGAIWVIGELLKKSKEVSKTRKFFYVIGLILLFLFTKSFFDKRNALTAGVTPAPCSFVLPEDYDECMFANSHPYDPATKYDATLEEESLSETVDAKADIQSSTREADFERKQEAGINSINTIEAENTAQSSSASSESWRLPSLPGTTFIANDKSGDANWEVNANMHAKNLSITPPYYWEYYNLPNGTRIQNVRDYYVNVGLNIGYRIGVDDQGTNGVYLLTLIKGNPMIQKLAVQYWPQDTSYPPMVMVIYWGF